ncbi:MAG: hypothetical protein E5V92_28115 [Mesorhizobium sp.]|nr:MAG: hypothetical protein E5V92_28115 [Mesorhizobium sp.]
MEENFRRWESFDKTPRVASYSADGAIEQMPTSDGETYGFNTSTAIRRIRSRRRLRCACRRWQGYPILLAEMTILTALRIAAVSAIAAKHLAPEGARTMVIIATVPSPNLGSVANLEIGNAVVNVRHGLSVS